MTTNNRRGGKTNRNRLADNEDYVAIKMSLNQVLKNEYSAHFRQIILERAMAATRFQCLASLSLLYQANSAVDNNNDDFFSQNSSNVINKCFLGVNGRNINNVEHELPEEFKSMAIQNGIQWPQRSGMTNSFTYMVELYEQNIKTNLKRWCYKRIKTFFVMKKFEMNLQNIDIDDIDVKNALRAVFLLLDGTNDDADRYRKMNMLLIELIEVGGQAALNMQTFIRDEWFKSLAMWIKIQRQIEQFHITYNNTIPNKPNIRNFTAIPLCNTQLKHIKIDNTELTEIAMRKSQMGTYKKADDDNSVNRDDCWDSVFNLTKIKSMGKQKKFHYQFLSDSVSVSLVYIKNKSTTDANIEQQISNDFNTNKIIYELGIDPGMKTWNATVRRTISTNKEV